MNRKWCVCLHVLLQKREGVWESLRDGLTLALSKLPQVHTSGHFKFPLQNKAQKVVT